MDNLSLQFANLAVKSMLYEVTVNPKPGLVDPQTSGPHSDMQVFMFIDSAVSLTEYFAKCFAQGVKFKDADLTELFKLIRPIGVKAEATMFEATHGVNTHKGAIFSLGVLVCATGYVKQTEIPTSQKVLQVSRQMLAGLTSNDFKNLASKKPAELTAGEKQFLKYGLSGIRGQAEAGFPSVAKYALPYLKQADGTLNERLLDTLMIIVQHTEDSNLIKRAGNHEIISIINQKITHYFELGGSQTKKGYQYLLELNQYFMENNLSLGGSADLLILTIYLAFIDQVI